MYNGYTNWETYCICLHLDNDEPLHAYWSKRAKHCTVFQLANEIKESFFEMIDENNSMHGLFSDLLHGALSSANWREVAETFATEEDET